MDIYSKAIEFLKNNESLISSIWDDPKSHWTGVLFQAVTPDGTAQQNSYGLFCGDICEIRTNNAHAWTLELQQEIANDPRIPKIFASNNYIPKITINNLEIFAEWQRKIDKTLNRSASNFKVE